MCFSTTDKTLHTATVPIPVYKRIKGNNEPEFLEDRVGNMRTMGIRRGDREGDDTLVQLYRAHVHYKDLSAYLELESFGEGYQAHDVHRGFHSWHEPPRNYGGALKVVQFTIPVGAKYRIGSDWDNRKVYISNEIVAGTLSPL